MCGIAGFQTSRSKSNSQLRDTALKMSDAIQHRGPDAADSWTDETHGIALSHRRLAIVDLSPTGAQPMVSHNGQLVMVYNGEIYNAEDLRKELTSNGSQFRGTSDTEVILEGFAAWGIRKTIARCIGMFALAVWNREDHTLSLVRDRLGIKPLYWSQQTDELIFGSELKALRAHPDCAANINSDVLAGYLRKGYINHPNTIYQDVNQLPPGCILHWNRSTRKSTIEQYWSLKNIVEDAYKTPFNGSSEDATDQLESLLKDAINRRMVADVPLGAFLSGGIDSSAVVALMQECSSTPVKTFSIGFDEKKYDESAYAAAVAQHIGTDHTELIVTAKDALNVVPLLPSLFDEPFADPSQIPTYLVSKLTREHVTVALSGDGGDELFAGYTRYQTTQKFRRLLSQPGAIRKLEASLLKKLNVDRLKNYVNLPSNIVTRHSKDQHDNIASILRSGTFIDAYLRETSRIGNPEASLKHGHELPVAAWTEASDMQFTNDDYAAMQYIDMLDYLPDDILTKVDRTSMAVSLEARVPILDHRVVEFSWRLNQSLKVQNNQGKQILRNVLYRHVPKHLVDRPKKGFGVPISAWIKGPLREWAEELLSENKLQETNIFETEVIRQRWQEQIKGERNWEYHLWDVLMMQAWAVDNKAIL